LEQLLSQRRGLVWVGAVLLVGVLVGAPGIVSLPMEGHEVFVAETAQQMHNRGDWVVPYFNDQPRLNKPPMSYWLTGLTAGVTGGAKRIMPWHARLPSLLSGLALIGLTIWLGRMLFDQATGLVAGLMLATTATFFSYTHNARPEMLYAAWCTAAVAGFVCAWRSADQSPYSILASAGMWVSLALATLTKGPHVPAMLLVGFTGFLLSNKTPWRGVWRVMQPVGGLCLYAAIALPWWWLVHQQLPDQGLADSELTGKALRFDWTNILDPGFIFRLPNLILPWIVFLPAGVVLIWSKRQRSEPARLLGWIVIWVIILLSLGSRRHTYYLLPVLGPVCVLLAAGAVSSLQRISSLEKVPKQKVWLWVWAIHVVVVLCTLVWMLLFDTRANRMHLAHLQPFSLLVGIILVFGLLVTLFRPPSWQLQNRLSPLITVAVGFAILWACLGVTGKGWSSRRFVLADIAQSANMLVPAEVPLACWDFDASPVVYYTKRSVIKCRSLSEVIQAVDNSPGSKLAVLTDATHLPALSEHLPVKMLKQISSLDPKDNPCLVEVTPANGVVTDTR